MMHFIYCTLTKTKYISSIHTTFTYFSNRLDWYKMAISFLGVGKGHEKGWGILRMSLSHDDIHRTLGSCEVFDFHRQENRQIVFLVAKIM